MVITSRDEIQLLSNVHHEHLPHRLDVHISGEEVKGVLGKKSIIILNFILIKAKIIMEYVRTTFSSVIFYFYLYFRNFGGTFLPVTNRLVKLLLITSWLVNQLVVKIKVHLNQDLIISMPYYFYALLFLCLIISMPSSLKQGNGLTV